MLVAGLALFLNFVADLVEQDEPEETLRLVCFQIGHEDARRCQRRMRCPLFGVRDIQNVLPCG